MESLKKNKVITYYHLKKNYESVSPAHLKKDLIRIIKDINMICSCLPSSDVSILDYSLSVYDHTRNE